MHLAFTVYGEAQPQGSAKAFVPRGWSRPIITSDNPALKSWRQLVAEAANRALSDQAAADRALLMDGVRLSIAFYLPRPKSLPKKSTAHTKKPDIDKLVRACCDALSTIVFQDDSQVCELADLTGWTRVQREQARTWALQELDAQKRHAKPVRWPAHVTRAHRRRPPRARRATS